VKQCSTLSDQHNAEQPDTRGHCPSQRLRVNQNAEQTDAEQQHTKIAVSHEG